MGYNVPITERHLYQLTDLWVNYQYKHEFNPLHDHSGVYSFVIWMKIPTSFSDQKKNPLANQVNDNSISVIGWKIYAITYDLNNKQNIVVNVSDTEIWYLIMYQVIFKHY